MLNPIAKAITHPVRKIAFLYGSKYVLISFSKPIKKEKRPFYFQLPILNS